jgi:hypothetical protein
MPEKMVTFTVMHDKGEKIDGKKIRPYETFRAIMTPDYQEKVKKGFLVIGTVKEESETPKSTSRRSSKKAKK